MRKSKAAAPPQMMGKVAAPPMMAKKAAAPGRPYQGPRKT